MKVTHALVILWGAGLLHVVFFLVNKAETGKKKRYEFRFCLVPPKESYTSRQKNKFSFFLADKRTLRLLVEKNWFKKEKSAPTM